MVKKVQWNFRWSLQLLPWWPLLPAHLATLGFRSPEVSYTPCPQLLPHQMHELTTGVKARLGFALPILSLYCHFSLAFSSNWIPEVRHALSARFHCPRFIILQMRRNETCIPLLFQERIYHNLFIWRKRSLFILQPNKKKRRRLGSVNTLEG
jgi:hypothetical protein